MYQVWDVNSCQSVNKCQGINHVSSMAQNLIMILVTLFKYPAVMIMILFMLFKYPAVINKFYVYYCIIIIVFLVCHMLALFNFIWANNHWDYVGSWYGERDYNCCNTEPGFLYMPIIYSVKWNFCLSNYFMKVYIFKNAVQCNNFIFHKSWKSVCHSPVLGLCLVSLREYTFNISAYY